MKENSFSIIIPVYNSEEFLETCISSIINQTYNNFEAIFIDDGSTDKSLNILMENQKKEKRIKVIHKKNEGVSIARNCGLDIVNNEYIMFVDSDDVLDINALKYYNDIINKNKNIDFFQTSLLHFEHEVYNEYSGISEERILSDNERTAATNKLLMGDTRMIDFQVFPGPVCKIYKKEILENYHIRFNENFFMYEDGIFNIEYLLKCKSILCSNHVTYYYRTNFNSITHSYNPRYASQRLIMIEYIKRIIAENNLDIKFYYIFIYQSIIDILSFNVFSKNVKMKNSERKEKFIKLRNNEIINNSFVLEYINDMTLKKKVLITLFKHKQFLLLKFIYSLFK